MRPVALIELLRKTPFELFQVTCLTTQPDA